MQYRSKKGIVRRAFRTARSDEGILLGRFLEQRCSEAPVGFLNRLIRQGFVTVDGHPAMPKSPLRYGQRIAVMLPPGASLVAPNAQVSFRIVFEDEHLLVVEKPAGVVSEPGLGHKLDTLLNGLIARYGEILDRMGPKHDFGMVHRLDRDTSGLLVVAKSADIQGLISEQFRARSVKKRYYALLAGRLTQDEGRIGTSLKRVRQGGRAVVLAGERNAASAITEFKVIERFAAATLVWAIPRTGRWRQLRVHFESLGHPVVGDNEEGDSEVNALFKTRYGLNRMFLHAAYLRFRHPVLNKPMEFSSPLPVELEAALYRLRGVSA